MTIPLFDGDEFDDFDWRDEWVGMPEFHQDNQNGYRTIKVRFSNQQGVDEFAKLLNQRITPEQQLIRFPAPAPRPKKLWIDGADTK